ncbi:MAG: hypothetical protein LQ337_006631 [Flavoplaca oasis]|nr:MAG: hypothetical protein LQ337_006631 [Flavoplaca oasis]
MFIFLCLLVDIGMLAYLGFKMYRLCRRLRTGVSHDSGAGVAVEHEEKGLVVNGANEEEDEQLPAYYDHINGESDQENNSTITSYGDALLPSLDNHAKVNDVGVVESVSFPSAWFDFRNKRDVVQALLNHMSMYSEQDQDLTSSSEKEDVNKETVEPACKEVIHNGRIVSPTSKAAHVSPHGKDCLACHKLSPINTITNSDHTGCSTESVTFPLTWDDMCEHGSLIKWFLENHNIKDFILKPDEHYTFHDNSDEGSRSGDLSPTSKAAHLSPHDNCDYCIQLACADKVFVIDSDGFETCLTFPLTMDDMLHHKDSVLACLPNWPNNAWVQWGTLRTQKDIHFDEDIRLKKDTMVPWA